jgi:hypothetical protein
VTNHPWVGNLEAAEYLALSRTFTTMNSNGNKHHFSTAFSLSTHCFSIVDLYTNFKTPLSYFQVSCEECHDVRCWSLDCPRVCWGGFHDSSIKLNQITTEPKMHLNYNLHGIKLVVAETN